MPDQTLRAVEYCLPVSVGRGKPKKTATWAAWSSTRTDIHGYGMTRKEAIEDLEENLKTEGGEEDAE